MFKSQNFCHIASNNRNQVKVGVFVYRTTDDLATVLTSGYFNDRIIDINLHDLIIHEKIDSADATKVQRNLLCVTERSLENVGTTLVKSQWEEDIESVVESIQDDIETIQDDIETIQGDITDIKAKDIEQDGRLDDIESGVAYKATDFKTPITNTNKGITETEETALNDKIDLAANSGRMITDQGVWYAKMYAATVAPSAENGTNYADFSQTDGQGNPVIVLYERQNGAWVQTQTIVPPAEYDGYVPITSKIWDIVEQAGQQGGRILWNHQSKDFTPYPQIISFENAALTGVSTAPTPTNDSPNNQIANKEYVDNKASQQGYHPDLFDVKWADHICNDVQWLRADTFSWQSGAVYQAAYAHLVDDYNEVSTVFDWTPAVQDTNLGGNYWDGLVWDGSKFVALGADGYISTSTDGANWTSAVQNTNLGAHDWYALAWNGSKFVALGNRGYISTSTDGTTWTPAVQDSNLGVKSWFALVWDGSKFVALGSAGYISTSADGTSWTPAVEDSNLGRSANWKALTWDGSKFVALGAGGHISTSADGVNWTPAVQDTNLGENYWFSLAWNGFKFMALGNDGYVSTSTDGINWTPAVQDTNLGAHDWYNVAWNGSKFVALGQSGYTSIQASYQTETIAGITIEYYQAVDGHKIVLANQENNVESIYNATGVAWYYIVDETNQRFKLPRTKFGFTGIRSSVGKFIDAGLPNITGTMTAGSWASGFGYDATATGAFYNVDSWGNDANGGGATTKRGIGIDASRSSSVYGNSDTVQPKATEMYLYFYVGNFTQTALENTAGLNTELFNGKADLNLANVLASIDFVVEKQEPTAENNYTWYRKYRSGWVEQGARYTVTTSSPHTMTLPVTMANTYYSIMLTPGMTTTGDATVQVHVRTDMITTTSFGIQKQWTSNSGFYYWRVEGMAA